MKKYLIGLDVGTSGAKCIIANNEGTVVASSTQSYPLHTPKPGWANYPMFKVLKDALNVPMEIDTEYWNETQRTGKQPETYTTACGNEVAWSDDFRKEMLRRTKNLERGDLVFFGTPATEPGKKSRISHVGIYLGDGKIIHSSHMVRINSLIPGDEDYYENSWKLVGAVRL